MPVIPSTDPHAISQVHITADRRVADLTSNAAAQLAGHAETSPRRGSVLCRNR